LVGAALWAVKMALAQSCNDYVFPKYCSSSEVKANSASAALNKWLKAKVSEEVVIHSLRHAFRQQQQQRPTFSPTFENQPPRAGGWACSSIFLQRGVGKGPERRNSRYPTHHVSVRKSNAISLAHPHLNTVSVPFFETHLVDK